MQHDVSNYTESHIGKGEGYDEHFESRPGRKLMWTLERGILQRILGSQRFGVYLDFACGTGRILSEIAPFADEVYGVDISESMLEVARSKCQNAKFLVADVRSGLKELGERQFDLVTAFRFFPNAEVQLRWQAMNALSGLLRPGGIMIFNNHRNTKSLSYRAFRFSGRRSGEKGMNDDEVVELVAKSALRIVGRYSLGVLPQSEKRSVLPWKVTSAVERGFASRFAHSQMLGYNVIYVMQKAI